MPIPNDPIVLVLLGLVILAQLPLWHRLVSIERRLERYEVHLQWLRTHTGLPLTTRTKPEDD